MLHNLANATYESNWATVREWERGERERE